MSFQGQPPALSFAIPSDLLRALAISQHDSIANQVRSITLTIDPLEKEQEDGTEDEQTGAPNLLDVKTGVNYNGHGLWASRLLSRFKGLQSLTVECGTKEEQLSMHDDAFVRQFTAIQDAITQWSIHLKELTVEWLHIKFFLSNATEIGQNWKSLTALRLGFVYDKDLRGIEDLKLVLHELTNLRQLHLSSSCPGWAQLESLVDGRKDTWHKLTHLTLRHFRAQESSLRRLLSIESIRNMSLDSIKLEGDGCWIRLLTELKKKKWERVELSCYLANGGDDGGWGGDSLEDGNILEQAAEWLMEDDENGENIRGCPLTTENMSL